MAFTKRTIQHVFHEVSGAAASGSVTFTLLGRMTNAGVSLVPSEVTATLNGSGELSVELTSTEDSGTVPTDARYRVDIRLPNATVESYTVKVPAGPGTTNLESLLPKQPLGG